MEGLVIRNNALTLQSHVHTNVRLHAMAALSQRQRDRTYKNNPSKLKRSCEAEHVYCCREELYLCT